MAVHRAATVPYSLSKFQTVDVDVSLADIHLTETEYTRCVSSIVQILETIVPS